VNGQDAVRYVELELERENTLDAVTLSEVKFKHVQSVPKIVVFSGFYTDMILLTSNLCIFIKKLV